MDILYRACDGTIFDEEFDCMVYEEKIKLREKEIDKIHFFDENNEEYFIKENPFDDDIYYNCVKILVENKTQVEVLSELAGYCGWCEFEQIPSPGFWVRQAPNDYSHRYDGYWKKIN